MSLTSQNTQSPITPAGFVQELQHLGKKEKILLWLKLRDSATTPSQPPQETWDMTPIPVCSEPSHVLGSARSSVHTVRL